MRGFGRLALPALALPLIAQADVTIEAGRWEERFVPSRVLLDGAPLGPDMVAKMAQTRARCVTPERSKDPLGFILSREVGCAAPQVTGGAAGFTIRAQCTATSDEGPRDLAAQGNWTRDSYRMTMAASGPAGDHQLTVEAALDGRRTGACRGDEETG
ncbi:DUF3617 domain-containing protein [Sphingomonas sanxanigenens]|uniref:DUF3617 family protein n=1 Tax=Sphingomonas sanxanigenens DSM 19645 = NX02 TaxID=1123269 RepID=W0A9J3_9SPHN|nr:DUF3617 family protein [Sphingomonas sanxanigenens]AHE52350.1 hypothetical protein NX02_02965 [Sphingomonas sanxanigenens DSM 19645 = NX02]